jgi:hypothetical protein
MKTIYKSIMIIAILFLSGMTINTSHASKPAAEKALSTKDMQNFAPVTPVEADFNNDYTNPTFDIIALAPTTPIEADFNDDVIDLNFDTRALAPTTPAEADFSDSL